MTKHSVRRLTAVACFLIAACGASGLVSAQVSKVKFGYFPAAVDIPVFIAESQGFLKKNGLEVEMISFSSGPGLIGSLLSGSTNFIDGGGALLAFPQVTKGHEVRGVANFWSQNYYTVIVRNSVPTPNAGRPYPAPILDLKGKRLGVVALGSYTSALAESVLRDAGLRPGQDVTLIPSGAVATAIASLLAGNIDGYISYPPINQLLDSQYPGSYKVLMGGDQYPPRLRINFFNHVATTQKFIDSNPVAVEAMCKSIRESLEWLRDPRNTDAAVKGLEKWLPGNPPGVIAAALKASMPMLMGDQKNLGKITPEQIENGNTQLVGLGYVKEGVSHDKYVYKKCNQL